MDKIEVCKKVADKLWAAEHALDETMVRTSQLLEGLVEARRELNLSAVAGEVATTRVCESIAALSEARRAVMAAHGALDNLNRKMLGAEMIVGPSKDGQTQEGVTQARAGLRVAASQ